MDKHLFMKSSEQTKCGCFKNFTNCFKFRNVVDIDEDDDTKKKRKNEKLPENIELLTEKTNKSEMGKTKSYTLEVVFNNN